MLTTGLYKYIAELHMNEERRGIAGWTKVFLGNKLFSKEVSNKLHECFWNSSKIFKYTDVNFFRREESK